MNIMPQVNDTITTMIQKRIRYFKDLHERNTDHYIRCICQVKITTLEMILNDICTLNILRQN
jgi:hypothetical protein